MLGEQPLNQPGVRVLKGTKWRPGQTVLSAFCRSPATCPPWPLPGGTCLVSPGVSPDGCPWAPALDHHPVPTAALRAPTRSR